MGKKSAILQFYLVIIRFQGNIILLIFHFTLNLTEPELVQAMFILINELDYKRILKISEEIEDERIEPGILLGIQEGLYEILENILMKYWKNCEECYPMHYPGRSISKHKYCLSCSHKVKKTIYNPETSNVIDAIELHYDKIIERYMKIENIMESKDRHIPISLHRRRVDNYVSLEMPIDRIMWP